MATIRGRNYTDIDLGNGKRRVNIRKFMNFQDHTGVFAESGNQVNAQVAEPPAWSGAYDFDRGVLNAPMQFFARDAMDAGNRAMFGVRLSDNPGCWVNYKAHNIDNASDAENVGNNAVQWVNLWTDTDYRVSHGGFFVKVDFVLKGQNHPASFTETVKLSAGMSLQENGDNTISIMKDGEQVFIINAPFGYKESDEERKQVVAVTMTLGAKVNGMDTIVLTPNADDLASVGYAENIVIDPTTSITDTDIEDAVMWGDTTPTYNLGANTVLQLDGDAERRSIMRVDESLIPAGTIDTVTFKFTPTSGQNHDFDVYEIASGNYGWVEGTTSYGEQTGSHCWSYYAWDASSPTNWAGSAGLSTSGTDYVADASPPNFTCSSCSGRQSLDLGSDGTGWFTDWRDTPSNNAGMLFISNGTNLNQWASSENATAANRPEFEIEYTPTAAEDAAFFGCNF